MKLEPTVADHHWTLAQIILKQVQQASVFRQMGLSKRFRQESDAAMALDLQHIPSRRGSIGYYVNAPSIAGGDTKKAEALVEEVARIDRAAGYLARAQFINESKAGGYFCAVVRGRAGRPASQSASHFAVVSSGFFAAASGVR